jgi:hypothetical protein
MNRQITAAAALCIALSLSSVHAQTANAPDSTPKAASSSTNAAPASPAAGSTPAGTAQKGAEPVFASFTTGILAGGAINTVTINLPMNRIPERLHAEFTWSSARRGKELFSCENVTLPPEVREGLTKAERIENAPDVGGQRTVTVMTLSVPSPHCSWPPWQEAQVTLKANVIQTGGGEGSEKVLFDGRVRVSVFWFPLVVTLAVVGAIYPGCAAIAWYVKRRRVERTIAANPASATDPANQLPNIWSSLDPVQITANPYGRASLAKLQIFGFSLLVFALMLYYQLRTGILIALSIDILALLGISAVGATGGKLTQVAKRRLSFANWAWLRRNQWLPTKADDFSPRARWSELVTDYDGKEFDVYSFQMAIFSLIVAVALITTNLAGGEAFHIPPELLGLLGISQGVFIVGRATGPSAYQDLDKALDEVRKQSAAYFSAKAAGPDKQTDMAAALSAFRTAAQQAAQMFWDLYGEQIGEDRQPAKLAPSELAALTPEATAGSL